MHRGLSEPEFYGDLVCKFEEIEGGADFSGRFGEVVVRCECVGYGINMVRRSWCLTQSRLVALLPLWLCAGGSGVGLDGGPDIELFVLVGWGRNFFVRCLARRGSVVGFLFLRCFGGVVWRPRGLRVSVVARFFRVLVFVWS